jgi:hypothetical protein
MIVGGAMSFKCGACGTRVTNLWTLESILAIQDAHACVCPAVRIAEVECGTHDDGEAVVPESESDPASPSRVAPSETPGGGTKQ